MGRRSRSSPTVAAKPTSRHCASEISASRSTISTPARSRCWATCGSGRTSTPCGRRMDDRWPSSPIGPASRTCSSTTSQTGRSTSSPTCSPVCRASRRSRRYCHGRRRLIVWPSSITRTGNTACTRSRIRARCGADRITDLPHRRSRSCLRSNAIRLSRLRRFPLLRSSPRVSVERRPVPPATRVVPPRAQRKGHPSTVRPAASGHPRSRSQPNPRPRRRR